MADVSLLKKLLLKPGQRILLLNPPTNFLYGLGDPPEGMMLDSVPEGKYDAVILFVKDKATLYQMKPVIMEAIKYDGLLWITYPKKSSRVITDLSRDILWKEMADTGWRPVTMVSVDDILSAMRFRPVELVGR